MPRAAQARAGIVNGAGGSRARQRSRNAACLSGSRRGHERARRADAAGERLPPRIEGLVLEGGVQDRALDLAQAGRVEQRGEVALAHAREVRFVLGAGIDLASGLPEQAERAALAGVVPDARGDDAAAPDDARHLGQPGDRIRHEMDDELGEGRVERPVRERQVLGGGLRARRRPGIASERRRRTSWDGSTAATAPAPEPRDELGR